MEKPAISNKTHVILSLKFMKETYNITCCRRQSLNKAHAILLVIELLTVEIFNSSSICNYMTHVPVIKSLLRKQTERMYQLSLK